MNKAAAFADFGLGKSTFMPATNQSLVSKLLALPAYHWILLAVLLLMLPHFFAVPTGLMALAIFSVVMQKPSIKAWVNRHSNQRLPQVYQGLKFAVFLGASVSLWVFFDKTFGVDVAVSFLILCLITKLWELWQKRDAYVVLNLGLFVLASAFLIRQNIEVALVIWVGVLAVLMAFVALGDDTNVQDVGRFRTLMMLTLPALPLLVLLFLFFPRIPPIWSMPMAVKSATTGVSDSLSMGDFSNLSQSSELAFRVEFDGQLPQRQQMYWRGLVFSVFDGKTWRQNDSIMDFWLPEKQPVPSWVGHTYQGRAYNYQVILEPTQQHWLFALDYPKPLSAKLSLTSDFTVQNTAHVTQRLRYQVSAYPDAQVDLMLSDELRQSNLQLPQAQNPKSQVLARQLFEQSNFDPVHYIQNVKQHISTQGFSYTLSPPILKNHRVDEFLFDTKAGFCEHYASSFAFLMRAVGIPARVVIGYQGGELGRDGQSWEVRQMDAHAWNEVWLQGQGWVRIDPTSFVSPHRIDGGMNAVTQTQGASMFGEGVAGQWSYRQFQLLQTLRRYSDQVGYYWQRDVVGYDQDKQKQSLFQWFKIASFAQQFWVLTFGFVVMVTLFVVVAMYRRKQRHHVLDVSLFKLSKRLGKSDLQLKKLPNEPYLSWLDRVEKKRGQMQFIGELKTLYRQHRYGQIGYNRQVLKRLKWLTKQIK